MQHSSIIILVSVDVFRGCLRGLLDHLNVSPHLRSTDFRTTTLFKKILKNSELLPIFQFRPNSLWLVKLGLRIITIQATYFS